MWWMDLQPYAGPAIMPGERDPQVGDLYYGPDGELLGIISAVHYKFGFREPIIEYMTQGAYDSRFGV